MKKEEVSFQSATIDKRIKCNDLALMTLIQQKYINLAEDTCYLSGQNYVYDLSANQKMGYI